MIMVTIGEFDWKHMAILIFFLQISLSVESDLALFYANSMRLHVQIKDSSLFTYLNLSGFCAIENLD